jgi:hypothetical protein
VITGVLVDQVAKEQGRPICLPDRITTDQAITAISGFFAENPSLWNFDGNSVVGVALQKIYPCNH